jgi:hypothetical protein
MKNNQLHFLKLSKYISLNKKKPIIIIPIIINNIKLMTDNCLKDFYDDS